MVFQPGQSGNPNGRPKDTAEVRELAKKYTLQAIERLADIMDNGDKDAAKINAATALLDRGWGRPSQSIDIDDAVKDLVQLVIKK